MNPSRDSGDDLSQSSGWRTRTDEVVQAMVPGLPVGGVPVRIHGERDVMAVLAAVFLGAGLMSVATIAISWDGNTAAGPWPWFALIVPHFLALAAVLAATFLSLPGPRWVVSEELSRRPRPLLLRFARVFGFLARPIDPLLRARNLRERTRILSRDEVERTIRALLALPRTTAGLVLGGLVAVHISDAMIVGHQLLWSWSTALTHLGVWLGLTGPMAVITAAGVRQAMRTDLLAAPHTHVYLRNPPPMTRAAAFGSLLVLTTAAIVPLLLATLWVQAQARTESLRHAERAAHSLLAAAEPGNEAELGRLLAELPGASLRTATGAAYGLRPPLLGVTTTRRETSELRARAGGHEAAVAIPSPAKPPLGLILGVAGFCLTAGAAAVWLLLRRRERDLENLRASLHQPDAAIPGPTTPEWTGLAQAIDQLTARMHEASIARFVALEKAEETDRLRSQFLANMSHDLRSPLNSILGFSSLLLRGVDGNLDDEQREMVETIANAGNDLLRQIDAILDMARIEARRIEFQAEPVPLAPLISRAVQRARTLGSEQIQYSLETAPGLPTAFIDPRHLVQALENLLVFAGKNVPGGVIAVRLRPGDRDSPYGLQIHVTTPIKPATLQQLELARRGFHRLPGHRGLGLELPIADALLRIEGCRLDVKEVGGAMLFKIHLPAAETRHSPQLIERARAPRKPAA